MENTQATSFNGHSEYGERREKIAHSFDEVKHYIPDSSGDQITLDYLMNSGFVWEEAMMLLYLREHLYENPEMHQRMTDDLRMHFARWLYTNGEMTEG